MADLASNPDSTVPNTSNFGIDTVARNLANAAIAAAAQPPQVSVDVSATYNTTTVQSQVGLQFGSVSKTFETPLGEKVVDSSLISKIRPRTIHFSAYHMKPNTRLYAFFDNVNVSKYVYMSYRIVLNKAIHANSSKTFSVSLNSVEVVFARGKTIYVNQSIDGNLAVANTFTWDGYTYTVVSVEKSTTLTTDVNGYIAGNFLIPPDTFDVGSRAFLLCDSSANNAADITTSSEFMYYASGLANTKQAETLSTRINQVTINPLIKSSQTSVANTSVTPTASNPVNPVVITADSSAPVILSYSPGQGETGTLTSGTAANYTFNKTIAAGSAYSSISVTKKNGTSPVTITKSLTTTNTTSDSIYITFDSPLEPGTEYKVNLPSGCVNDTSGNAYKDDGTIYSFTTASAAVVGTSWTYGSNTTIFTGWRDFQIIPFDIYIDNFIYDSSRLVYDPTDTTIRPNPSFIRQGDEPKIFYKCVQVGSDSLSFATPSDFESNTFSSSSGQVNFNRLFIKNKRSGIQNRLSSFTQYVCVEIASITSPSAKFKIEFYKDSLVGTPVYTSGVFTVEKATTPLLVSSIRSSKTEDNITTRNSNSGYSYITEGSNMICDIKTRNTTSTAVTWKIVGTDTSDADFTGGTRTGSFVLDGSGKYTLTIPVKDDGISDPNEVGSIIFTYNAGAQSNQSPAFSIIDTGGTPVAHPQNYTIAASTEVEIGNIVVVLATKRNISSDVPLYWRYVSDTLVPLTDTTYFNSISGKLPLSDKISTNPNILYYDFYSGTKLGSFISGEKYFYVQISETPGFELIQGTSNKITLKVPSTTVKTATITTSDGKSTFVEGENITFTVTTSPSIGDTDPLYFTIAGTGITSADFSDTGSVAGYQNILVPTRTNGTVTFTKTIAVNTD